MSKEHTIKLDEEQLGWLIFSLGYASGKMFDERKEEWTNKTITLFENIREQAYGTKKTGE